MGEENNLLRQIVGEIKAVASTLKAMDIWLPQAIDNALHGHKGKLDHVDMEEMTKKRKEDDKRAIEINALRIQVEETKKQTKYVFWGVIILAISLIATTIFNIIAL